MPVDAAVLHVHKKSSPNWQRILHLFSETFHPWQPPQPGLFCQWHTFLVIRFWQIYFLLTGLRLSTAFCTDLSSCCPDCTARACKCLEHLWRFLHAQQAASAVAKPALNPLDLFEPRGQTGTPLRESSTSLQFALFSAPGILHDELFAPSAYTHFLRGNSALDVFFFSNHIKSQKRFLRSCFLV
jgi:hypothetical protein